MCHVTDVEIRRAGRTPHGVRGLKFQHNDLSRVLRSRTPHGVRGLKFADSVDVKDLLEVAPLTGCVD